MDWANEELGAINLGDKRLNARARKLLNILGANPSLSIPASCKGWAETKAAYRFFDNELVSEEKIFECHRQSTLERIKYCPVVLLIQDTSTLNYSGQKARKDVGPIQCDSSRGIFLHPTIAVTPERQCLGVINYHHWFREGLAHKSAIERSHDNHRRPITEKESNRWLESYRQANTIAQTLPDTQIISVADREGDIYDIYQEAQNEFANADWLIRSHYNRSVKKNKDDNYPNKLRENVKKNGAIGTLEFEVCSATSRKRRVVKQEIYLKEVVLLPSARKKKAGSLPVKTMVIIASETNAPENEKPIEWVLLTSVKICNLEEAKKVIQWYICRWQIEIYFKILKGGCNIEKLQLTNEKRFGACLALYLIIAWRILFITMLGREYPNLDCGCIFDSLEWQTAYIVAKKEKPPSKPPKLNEMIKIIAQLGGFLGRKGDGDPGPTVMWKGLRNIHAYIEAREVFEDVYGHTYG